MSLTLQQLAVLSAQVKRLVEERNDARAIARAILRLAQEHLGAQVVSDHVLTVHPWLLGEEREG